MSSRRNRLHLAKETLRHLPTQALARVAGGTNASEDTTCPTQAGCETMYTCPSEIPCPIVGRKSLALGCPTR